jgi:SSS family solute:Na+ symporter
MLLPLVVIAPGLIALALTNSGDVYQLPLKVDGRVDFDMTLPTLLAHFYPSGLLGVGLTALMASFMSGMAGNVTAFNSVWTYDIYQAYIKPKATDDHYLFIARLANIGGILLSVATAYLATRFNNIMDLLQLVFSFVNAPLFATFLLGMFWKRSTGHGAFYGLLGGTVAAAVMHGTTLAEGKGGWLIQAPLYEFGSGMAQALSIAIVAWSSCFILTVAISLTTKPKPESSLKGLVYGLTERPGTATGAWYSNPLALGLIVLGLTLMLNLFFA